MKVALLSFVVIGSFGGPALAKADPRPPGGHRIISKPIPAGTCRKQLVYLNKFSSAYQTVCNNNQPFRWF